ncbi:probable DNA double-strand break repair Rad50 ATPase isoform X2 [Struthio camelus]|uniref:probable DNA double-strand break repair Rad50 ATPase isoform X2 n=1 Tax=Struthio camelus TaxID=8801 RepID=UPI003603E3BF
MDEEQYFASEENIPLSSRSWLWKKTNSVSPAAKSQSKTEAWVQTVIPSIYQVSKDSVKSNADPKLQTSIHSSVPLPGSVIDYSDETQQHPSCVIQNVMTEEEPDQDHANTSGVCSADNNKVTELEECRTKEELLYIPYKLAKLYITKIVEDMQQMKIKHTKIIKELGNIRKENQEQTITTMKKHYGDKMRSVKAQLEAYQELMNKRSTHWQVTIKNLRERNRQLSQDKEELLHQINHQTEKWKEEKTWILENVSKNLDRLYAQHILTLQELQNLSLYVEKVHDLVNFRIKNLQKKSEKTAIEKADVSVVLELKAEQVADKEMKPEWLVEKGYLWEARVMLQKIQESLDKREKEVAELLQSARRYSKALKPQITMQIFLKTLVQRVHNIYCDVPEAQQYLHQLIRKNKDERAGRKETFNNAQADILSYEVFSGNEPMDDKRTQVLTKLFRNLGRAKSELEYVETEEIVFDCIQTGEIPNWIKKDCLYVALTADPGKDIYSAKTSHLPDEVMKKFKSQIKAANETKEQ